MIMATDVRTMLPFRVLKGVGDGAVELEFQVPVDAMNCGVRSLPFLVRCHQPVIKPILDLIRMYQELENETAPLRRKIEQLEAERMALQHSLAASEKRVDELRRQLNGGRTRKAE